MPPPERRSARFETPRASPAAVPHSAPSDAQQNAGRPITDRPDERPLPGHCPPPRHGRSRPRRGHAVPWGTLQDRAPTGGLRGRTRNHPSGIEAAQAAYRRERLRQACRIRGDEKPTRTGRRDVPFGVSRPVRWAAYRGRASQKGSVPGPPRPTAGQNAAPRPLLQTTPTRRPRPDPDPGTAGGAAPAPRGQPPGGGRFEAIALGLDHDLESHLDARQAAWLPGRDDAAVLADGTPWRPARQRVVGRGEHRLV